MKSAVVFADADVRNHRYGNFSKSGPARLGKRDQCRKHRAREASGHPEQDGSSNDANHEIDDGDEHHPGKNEGCDSRR
jgi:hypothetical protein